MFFFPLCFYGTPPFPRIPPPPAGAGGEIARGPHQTVSGPRKPHHLTGRRQFEHHVQSAAVRGWPSSKFHRLCGVNTDEKRISIPCLFPGESQQCHSQPSAQPTVYLVRRAHAWAHRWRRARVCRDWRAIAARSDRAGVWNVPQWGSGGFCALPSLQSAFQCWLPFLRSALEVWRLSNAHPPIYSCLLHHCHLAAPLLSLSPSSVGLLSSSIAVVGVSLDSTSESRTPPWPFDPSVPQWLLAPTSPPWPGSPLAPPGSLIPLAPPWSGVDHLFTSGLHSSGFTSSLWLRQAPSSPRLLLSPLSLRLHHGLPDPRLHVGHAGTICST